MKLLFTCALLIPALIAAVDYTGFKIYDVPVQNTKYLEQLENSNDVQILWKKRDSIRFITLSDRFCDRMECKLIANNFQEILDHEQNEQTRRIGAGVSFEKYERLATINQYLLDLSLKYPDFVTLIEIGKSYEGREMNLVRLSSDGDETKPAIFVDGGIHAREWISPATVLYILHQLVENRNLTHELTDEVNWYVLPVINVDGYEYTHTNERLWRKTRKPAPNSSCIGTDPNRNFDHHWMEIGASSSPCYETYAGPNAFSEPETQNLANFASKIKDQIKMYLTFHSYGQYLLYPWGYTYDLPGDAEELQTLGEEVNDAMDYDYDVGSVTHVLTPGAGGSDDYFKGALGVNLTYCIELPGNPGGFELPPSKIKGVVKDAFKGVEVFGKYVLNKFG